MKLTVNTATLQAMVAKAMKGASCNRMIPITNLIAIEWKDSTLTLTTTDAYNFLYIREDNVDGEDFYVVVMTDVFSKLVARLTCETVTLELDRYALKIRGNGNYKIDLPLNEDGELIRFPNPLAGVTLTNDETIKLSTVKQMLDTAGAALSPGTEVECYTGYYVCKDEIVTTDMAKICGIKADMLNEPALLSAETVKLLGVITDNSIYITRTDDTIVFDTEECTVFGKVMDCIDDYQIDLLDNFLTDSYASNCTVPRDILLQLLDRLSLFVGMYDKNCITLGFSNNGMTVTSLQANSTELIPFKTSENVTDFECKIRIDQLNSQVKANTGDFIRIDYGKENAIKLSDGNVTQVVALTLDN